LLRSFSAEIDSANSGLEFKELRDRWMSRKNGVLAQVNDIWLKVAPGPNKRDVGQRVNTVKAEIEASFAAKQAGLVKSDLDAKLRSESVDVSLPGIERPLGVRHPVLRTLDELISVFVKMGYSIAEGPEVESDYYNFEALNFPPNHPARDTQDTLFIAGQEQRAQRDRLLLDGEAAASRARHLPRQGASQRCAGRHPLAGLPPA
jgi:phenylalanyl-tRNA synthetase alpha chain